MDMQGRVRVFVSVDKRKLRKRGDRGEGGSEWGMILRQSFYKKKCCCCKLYVEENGLWGVEGWKKEKKQIQIEKKYNNIKILIFLTK